MKQNTRVNRRELLTMVGMAGAQLATARFAAADPGSINAAKGGNTYPSGFLWGASTAGHQVEGSNTNSDVWALEHVKPTIYAESSGDACDHYHRFNEDIELLAKLGFNSYRFSVEWSRIEPAPDEFLIAELDHYRRVLAVCHENGVAPVVTFNHGTTPRWFAAQGGWENTQSPDLFAKYCERVVSHLGDLISVASTLNEPNILLLIRWLQLPPAIIGGQGAMLAAAAKASGSDRFSSGFAGNIEAMQPQLLKAHSRGYAVLKAGRGKFPVGVNLAIMDDQAVGADSKRDQKRRECYQAWLEAAAQCDYVGVQTYGRAQLDHNGTLPPPAGAVLNQQGEEIYPQALEHTIRYAAAATGKPVYVTENGLMTTDDTQRVAFIKEAVAGVGRCLADGLDVRSYMHWSLLDNFEWLFGFKPKFGLIAVDRQTQVRTIKPSARCLGDIARAAGSRRVT